MPKMTEKGRVETTNQNGLRRVVVEMQHWTEYKPLSGPTQKAKGSTELFTADGHDVNLNSNGTYTVLQTDEILTPVSN